MYVFRLVRVLVAWKRLKGVTVHLHVDYALASSVVKMILARASFEICLDLTNN